MRVIFYLPSKAINEATIYYTQLVERALRNSGFEVTKTESTNIPFNSKEDFIFVIRVRDYIQAKLKFKTTKIILWYQGITAEEYLMINNYTLKAKIIAKGYDILERYSLKTNYFSFFVSEAMKNFFERKHKLQIQDSYAIVPCYNKTLQKKYFNSELKYENSFVYAGTLFAWQCFEKTAKLYSLIEKKNKNASFIVLTKEKEEAIRILEKYEIKNYEIKFVGLDDLDFELSKYKYGFILRENDPINLVSTPTKMNTYLSVGLMPIYTKAIDSFEKNLQLDNYEVKFEVDSNLEEIADKILKHNELDINYLHYFNVCESNFKKYYDDDYNIELITNTLIKQCNR